MAVAQGLQRHCSACRILKNSQLGIYKSFLEESKNFELILFNFAGG